MTANLTFSLNITQLSQGPVPVTAYNLGCTYLINEGTKVHNPRRHCEVLSYACVKKANLYADVQIRGSIRKFGKALRVALAACCLGSEESQVVLNTLSAF